MSNFKGHIWGSLILSALVVYAIYSLGNHFEINFLKIYIGSFEKMATLFLVSVIFSLFPDIDISSKSQKLFYFVFLILDLYFIFNEKYKSAALLGFFSFLPILSKHRSWTHRKITAVLVCSPLLLLPVFIDSMYINDGISYFSAALIGYFSHLIIDGVFFKF